jgi:hypothetical protein
MPVPSTIHEYLRLFGTELGERIVQNCPALQKADDPLSPRLATLLRKPFPAQAVAAMGLAKKWESERSAAVAAAIAGGCDAAAVIPKALRFALLGPLPFLDRCLLQGVLDLRLQSRRTLNGWLAIIVRSHENQEMRMKGNTSAVWPASGPLKSTAARSFIVAPYSQLAAALPSALREEGLRKCFRRCR